MMDGWFQMKIVSSVSSMEVDIYWKLSKDIEIFSVYGIG